MILEHIEAQTLQNRIHRYIFCKRHFQHNLNAFFVARFDHVLKLPHSGLSCRIRFFRREIIGRTISPVIDLPFHTFFKLIYRHALDLINPQFF